VDHKGVYVSVLSAFFHIIARRLYVIVL